MSSWWSPLHRRLALAAEVRRRGDALLGLQSLGFALAVPLLLRLPLPRLQALLERSIARHPSRASDPGAVASTVLETLQAGRPLVRTGCLTRGLTLYYFLRRAGVEVTLTFGMGRVPAEIEGDGFDGHCWLVKDGEPYLEARDPREQFAAMYSFQPEAFR
jgi:hypothetical protein